MNDYAFKSKHLILMLIAFLVLSVSCFVFMGKFFEKATSDLLKIWLNTERVSLDQGNYISSFSKLQRSIGNDSYIKGFVVSDGDGRTVFSTGEVFRIPGKYHTSGSFMVVHSGFFSNIQQAQFSKLRMSVYSSSADLMYIYLLIVGYIVLLSSIFAYFLKRIVTREEQVKNEKELLRLSEIASINQALSIQAKQVAHDIRSPLSVLNMIIPIFSDESEEKKDLIKQAVERINNIASELLTKSVTQSNNNYNYNPLKLIQRIINEKNVALGAEGILLKLDHIDQDITIFVKIKESDLERILSNIINNSIEAVDPRAGHIICSFNSYENNFEFAVADNGKGIPSHLIDKLGQQGASFGKESHVNSGSGLGLFHAKKVLEEIGGRLEISSRLNEGTVVRIQLPRA